MVHYNAFRISSIHRPLFQIGLTKDLQHTKSGTCFLAACLNYPCHVPCRTKVQTNNRLTNLTLRSSEPPSAPALFIFGHCACMFVLYSGFFFVFPLHHYIRCDPAIRVCYPVVRSRSTCIFHLFPSYTQQLFCSIYPLQIIDQRESSRSRIYQISVTHSFLRLILPILLRHPVSCANTAPGTQSYPTFHNSGCRHYCKGRIVVQHFLIAHSVSFTAISTSHPIFSVITGRSTTV